MTANEVVSLLYNRKVSTAELLDAVETRIKEVDHNVNSLPILCFDRARDRARRLENTPVDQRGVLQGLPVPIKDLTEVAGVRTTYGSKLKESHIPETSEILVDTLEGNGAVVYAKSNTPEFGTGGHTFNDVFGVTRNPYDLGRSAGGSSGGAAAALACGTAWLAHGSDMAGSLRTPASFCGVASLRPSPGLIAMGPDPLPFQTLAQEGPMARSVEDLALFTDAMVGVSTRAGISKEPPALPFLEAARRPAKPTRLAFSLDLALNQTTAEVAEVVTAALHKIEAAGAPVVEACPDLSDAYEAFDVLRTTRYALAFGDDLDQTRKVLKPEIVFDVECGLARSARDIRSAMAAQGRAFYAASSFLESYDALICPAAICEPFPVAERYVGFSEGTPISEYRDWLKLPYLITATTLPVISLPCGFTRNGLPVAIQVVGRPHGEWALFQLASWIELVLGWDARPIDPRGTIAAGSGTNPHMIPTLLSGFDA